MILRHKIKISKRHIIPVDRDAFATSLDAFDNGQYHWLTIQEMDRPVSDAQRRYYFGVIVKVGVEYTGYTKKEIHAYHKQLFLTVPGEHGLPPRVRSYSDLDLTEAETFHDNCRKFWFEVDNKIIIPLPNEVVVEDKDLDYY